MISSNFIFGILSGMLFTVLKAKQDTLRGFCGLLSTFAFGIWIMVFCPKGNFKLCFVLECDNNSSSLECFYLHLDTQNHFYFNDRISQTKGMFCI